MSSGMIQNISVAALEIAREQSDGKTQDKTQETPFRTRWSSTGGIDANDPFPDIGDVNRQGVHASPADCYIDAFSSREPAPTSLENALLNMFNLSMSIFSCMNAV
ncbi:hypothetical protein [Bradyrhizobium sp. dw_78]|uniref:hypothetical protein n=1 Tax=Bradyrhizobium sp. dw_78 TaxID=2719793 RepID=UPI001BD665BA|nr:hypothetical protein [Bradyrhizobium sp. dw_78]